MKKSKNFHFNKYKTILIILFFLIIFVLRFIHLSADPPTSLSWSGGYIGDPGSYNFNARNKVIFGKWKVDDWNLMYVSPLPHILTYIVFKISGVGLAQMNFIPAIFSFLTFIFLFIVLKREFNLWTGLIALFIIGFNYPFTMFSRIANRNMPMIFFLVLSIYFFQMGQKRLFWFFFSGFSCFLAFTAKGIMLYFIPGVLITFFFLWFTSWNLRKFLKGLSYFLLGISIALIAWLIFIYFPHKDIFIKFGTLNVPWLIPRNFITMLKNFWVRPSYYFSQGPVIFLISWLYILILYYKVTTDAKKIKPIELILAFWLIFALGYHSIIYYRAIRHTVPQIIPFGVLSSIFLVNFLKLEK